MPSGSDQLRVKFEALSLREASELASKLRVLAHGRVQIRRTSRLLSNPRWKVMITIPAISPTLARAVTVELRKLARHYPACRFVDANVPAGDLAGDGPLRVIIVDDSAPFRRAARELLMRRGYRVVGEAGSAAAAHDAVERCAPDALLIDVGLPDACGFELAGALIQARPDLGVLLVSADDPPARDERLDASGAQGFVLKSCLAKTPLERFWQAPSP